MTHTITEEEYFIPEIELSPDEKAKQDHALKRFRAELIMSDYKEYGIKKLRSDDQATLAEVYGPDWQLGEHVLSGLAKRDAELGEHLRSVLESSPFCNIPDAFELESKNRQLKTLLAAMTLVTMLALSMTFAVINADTSPAVSTGTNTVTELVPVNPTAQVLEPLPDSFKDTK